MNLITLVLISAAAVPVAWAMGAGSSVMRSDGNDGDHPSVFDASQRSRKRPSTPHHRLHRSLSNRHSSMITSKSAPNLHTTCRSNSASCPGPFDSVESSSEHRVFPTSSYGHSEDRVTPELVADPVNSSMDLFSPSRIGASSEYPSRSMSAVPFCDEPCMASGGSSGQQYFLATATAGFVALRSSRTPVNSPLEIEDFEYDLYVGFAKGVAAQQEAKLSLKMSNDANIG